MGAMLGRVVTNYRGLVETCQHRAIELGISRLEIDRLGGLPDGYSGKLLGKDDAPKSKGNRPKRMWPVGLESVLGTLGLKILLIEDDTATARTLALRKPVNTSNQRFENKCARKPPLEIENVEVLQPSAPPENRAPVSRAHLRIVKKRVRRYG